MKSAGILDYKGHVKVLFKMEFMISYVSQRSLL